MISITLMKFNSIRRLGAKHCGGNHFTLIRGNSDSTNIYWTIGWNHSDCSGFVWNKNSKEWIVLILLITQSTTNAFGMDSYEVVHGFVCWFTRKYSENRMITRVINVFPVARVSQPISVFSVFPMKCCFRKNTADFRAPLAGLDKKQIAQKTGNLRARVSSWILHSYPEMYDREGSITWNANIYEKFPRIPWSNPPLYPNHLAEILYAFV